MRRPLKILAWTLATLVAIPLVLIALLFAALNTAPGQREATTLLNRTLAGTATLAGLSGTFPNHLRLAHLTLHDPAGPWLTATGIALDWSPLALLHRIARIERLHAATLTVLRLPQSTPTPPGQSTPTKPFTLPVQIDLAQLDLPQLTLGPTLPGGPATLALTGHATLPSLAAGTIALNATRQDSPGTYAAHATLTPTTLALTLALDEPAHGLVARAASLPDLGPLALHATLAGPRTQAALDARLAAGPLRATATGALDLTASTADLAVQATAPAMTPRPGLSWQSIALDAHVAGPFSAPTAHATLDLAQLTAPSAALARLTATIDGNAGHLALDATATGLRIPGPNPTLLEAAPLHLTATATLSDPARPFTLHLTHPLLTVAAQGTATPPALTADLTLPDLTPLAALGHTPAAGHAALHLTYANSTLTADGPIALTAAPGPTLALLGPTATLGLTANPTATTLSRLTLTGTNLALTAHGSLTSGQLAASAHLTLPNLAAAAPTLRGHATLDATAAGPLTDLAATLDTDALLGTTAFPPAALHLHATAQHLPSAPTGTVQAQGTLDGAPLDLTLAATRTPDGTLAATLSHTTWRTLTAAAALTLPPGATLPQGHATLRIANLSDLHALTGQPLSGSLDLDAALDPSIAHLTAHLTHIAAASTRLASATLTAQIADPLATPRIEADLTAQSLTSGTLTLPTLHLIASGPESALALALTTTLDAQNTQATLQTAATLDLPAHHLALRTLTATARGQTLRLLAPASITYAPTISTTPLRLALSTATLTLAGRLSPTLDATLQAHLPANLAALYNPAYAATGLLTADAHLQGTPTHPTGTLHATLQNLHPTTGPATAAPPLDAQLTATLAPTTAHLDARLHAGTAALILTGTAPLTPTGPLALRAAGNLDLAALDPILTSAGRRARGRLTLDIAAAGTAAAPRLAGTIALARGELQDFAQGVHLTDITTTARLGADTLTIPALTAHAGPGTLTLAGTIGVLRPGIPLDLTLRLANARPLDSDRLTAELDGALTLRGPLASLAVAGTVGIRRADIRIPETLPPSVQTLNVLRPGQHPPTPTTPPPPIRLDLTVNAPRAIFIRGRGVDAELAGRLHVGGTATTPQISGGFDLRRGTISLAGTTLTFTKGRVGFDGAGVTGKIDPSLDLVATSSTAQVTATLTIGGYASKPTISLTSVPELPQDEVLAYLLFHRSAKDLGPFQLASIAAALAQISGVGGPGLNPLDRVRTALGLDRLSVDGGQSTPTGKNASPSLAAGSYVAPGIYVGAKQGVTGQGTGAEVQIDLTKRLKLQTEVGTATGGNQLGLTYQYEW